MNLESFSCVGRVLLYTKKHLLNSAFQHTLQFGYVFSYSSLHHMFSNLLYALIYFIKSTKCVEQLKNPFEFCVAILCDSLDSNI
jgi:hypothetical protein